MIVGVIGSGSIGPDLAYGFLSAIGGKPNARVYLVDIKEEALNAGVERIRAYARKGVRRGKLSAKVAAAIEAALTPTQNLSDLAEGGDISNISDVAGGWWWWGWGSNYLIN